MRSSLTWEPLFLDPAFAVAGNRVPRPISTDRQPINLSLKIFGSAVGMLIYAVLWQVRR